MEPLTASTSCSRARRGDGSRIVSSLSQSGSDSQVQQGHRKASTDSDRSLEVMYLTAIAVGRTDDLNEVLDRVLRLVFDWVEADRGCVMLRDNETGQLQPAARCDRAGEPDQPRTNGSPSATRSSTMLWNKKRGAYKRCHR